MRLKQDINRQFVQDTVPKVPLQESASVSVAASGTDSVTINVPSNEMYFIKKVTVTSGSNTTVNSLTVDGNDTYRTATFDTVTEYGDLITADNTVTISGSNAGTAAESLDIQIDGYKIVF